LASITIQTASSRIYHYASPSAK